MFGYVLCLVCVLLSLNGASDNFFIDRKACDSYRRVVKENATLDSDVPFLVPLKALYAKRSLGPVEMAQASLYCARKTLEDLQKIEIFLEEKTSNTEFQDYVKHMIAVRLVQVLPAAELRDVYDKKSFYTQYFCARCLPLLRERMLKHGIT